MTRRLRLTAVILTCAVLSALSPARPVFAQQDKPLSIHIISGSREYKSEPSLKAFKAFLEGQYRVKVTASWGHDGIKELDNLDALKDAELMLIFTRRMKLGEDQMAIIRAHWEQGKPIVGLRTSSHAFQKDDNETFDRKVIGGNYQGHFGNEDVKVEPTDAGRTHPVLEGVGPFTSKKLYKAGELAPDVTVLQTGDIGKAKHAVTWTRVHNGGRMFYSSLGVPSDFEDDQFRKMLVNAIFWTTKRDPAKLKK